METNFKGTSGEVEVYGISSDLVETYIDKKPFMDIEFLNLQSLDWDDNKIVTEANAQLITDAFNTRQQINCDLPEFLERYNKVVEEQKKSEEEIIKFGVWLTQNCTPSSSKDGWWVFKDIWLATDECLFRFR